MSSARTRDRRGERVRINGIALDVLNQVPYKSDPRTEPWVSDSIDCARALDVRVVLLAFFERGDLRNDAEGQAEVVRRLTRVARKARTRRDSRHRVVAQHRRLLRIVVQSDRRTCGCTDVANATQMGYDVAAGSDSWAGRASASSTRRKTASSSAGPRRLRRGAQDHGRHHHAEAGSRSRRGPKGKPMLDSPIENMRFMRAQFS
jgi:hypothetical protein